MRLVTEDVRRLLIDTLGQIPADDDHRDAGRAEVFLRARVNQTELRDVDRAGENVGGHVRHQRGGGRGEAFPLRAGDGLGGGEVHVGRAGRDVERVEFGQAGGDVLFRVSDHVNPANELGLLGGLGGPGARVDIVGDLAGAQQVHGHQGELRRRAAGHEKHGIIFGELQEFSNVFDSFVVDRFVFLATVAHLHEGHAGALKLHQLGLRLLQNFQRQYGRARAEIIYSRHGRLLFSLPTDGSQLTTEGNEVNEDRTPCRRAFESSFFVR